MHAAVKVLVGLILIIIGLGFFVDEVTGVISKYPGIPAIKWLTNFVVVLTGVIPVLLILIGLFVVWLELDELKTEKELKKEEESEKKEEGE
ncbi:MAG: hypothetical protein ISS36_03020 [Candidatus Aenigmarchaeota archaeon]|nr:hypothetical protein [Candidatus Aenigmarchaeota archaeon]